jgi:hypothetical protein
MMGGPQWTDDDSRRARTEAARLLGFTSAENLSAADNLKVDLVTSLRAVVDDASASVLEGTQTDLGKLVVAVEHLTKLLPQNQEPASRGADPRKAMLETYLGMRRRGELADPTSTYEGMKAEVEWLRAKIAELEAALAVSGAPPSGASAPAGGNVVTLPRLSASSGASAQPPKPAPPKPAEPMIDLRAGYSTGPAEPWKEFCTDVDGVPLSARGKYWGPV